ncbi:PNG1- with de-N-glycosylation function (N-glycanase) [Pyrenophora seminiperda CCB06]|uniref:PNG1-with de-N-glycosylation function (N-glycanase) n=1 Tax=Pyrenophora seminiperda CCB06 TaxID=1302712 RepID=A0A3M7M9H1_9PLEO|nr:PNG1- with de-N-glycosylation function (N-glycanase) [Pyrenophora seminiperda CCB06]
MMMASTITSTGISLPSILRNRLPTRTKKLTAKSCWPSPHESVGRFLVKIGGQFCWEAIGPARNVFLEICPIMKEYLDKHSEPKPCYTTWSIYMVGHTPETSIPTIIFCCENEDYRKEARDMIRSSGILKNHAGIALKHLPRAPDCNHLEQLASGSAAESLKAKCSDTCLFGLPVFSTAMRPSLGQALYIETFTGNAENIRMATAGPIIRIEGVECLLTAAHAFDKTPIQSYNNDEQQEDLCFSDSDSDSASDCSTPSFSTTNFLIEKGETLHVRTETMHTQKTVEPVNRNSVETQSVEVPENASYVGDALLLSSEDPQQGLDYALVRMRNRWRRYGREDFVVPKAIDVQSHLPCAPGYVITYTASAGLNHGIISETPTYIRAPNIKVFQETYSVRLNYPLATGDCGSWVFDVNSNCWRGHIVAGCPALGIAYIISAKPTFEDIQKNLPKIKDRLKQFEEHEENEMMEKFRQGMQQPGVSERPIPKYEEQRIHDNKEPPSPRSEQFHSILKNPQRGREERMQKEASRQDLLSQEDMKENTETNQVRSDLIKRNNAIIHNEGHAYQGAERLLKISTLIGNKNGHESVKKGMRQRRDLQIVKIKNGVRIPLNNNENEPTKMRGVQWDDDLQAKLHGPMEEEENGGNARSDGEGRRRSSSFQGLPFGLQLAKFSTFLTAIFLIAIPSLLLWYLFNWLILQHVPNARLYVGHLSTGPVLFGGEPQNTCHGNPFIEATCPIVPAAPTSPRYYAH